MSAFLFKHAGIPWTEVADLLDQCAKNALPNKDLEAAYYNIGEQARHMPEDIPVADIKIFDSFPKT